MRLAVQTVLIVAVLGALGFIVFGSTLAFPAPTAPSRRVVQEQPSPSGAHFASLVEVSGGGAAGYHYQEVSLRGRGSMDHVQVATRLYGATLRWLDEDHLEVGYDSGKPGRQEVDGVAISYHPGQR
ncbi:MAG: hypothetical protein KDC98_15795 [Planctomycetes bacterium]|nr:hypothetical protein [Planctomycetota bacterium]